MSQNPASLLARTIEAAGHGPLVAVTGAGISAASGLPLFRGPEPDAIWSRDVMEMGTIAAFRRDPVVWWRWFISRFGELPAARPNPAHVSIAALERWQSARGEFLLVTQNIDTLHEQAGSKSIVKIHGSYDRLRCARYGCRNGAPRGSLPFAAFDVTAWMSDPRLETLPRCDICGALLRPHALLFDEMYNEHEDYGLERALETMSRMKLLLLVGTSLAVTITHIALTAAVGRRARIVRIDPSDDADEPVPMLSLRARAEAILPEVCRVLGAR